MATNLYILFMVLHFFTNPVLLANAGPGNPTQASQKLKPSFTFDSDGTKDLSYWVEQSREGARYERLRPGDSKPRPVVSPFAEFGR